MFSRPALIPGFLCVVLGACGPRIEPIPPIPPPRAVPLDFLAARREPGFETSPRLSRGDRVRVLARDVEEFDSAYTILPSGMLRLPLVGDVRAAGKMPKELAAMIARRLEAMVINPEVEVKVEEKAGRTVTVRGAVNQPGEVSLGLEGKTLLQALQAAGGMADTAADFVRIAPSPAAPGVFAPDAGGEPPTVVEVPTIDLFRGGDEGALHLHLRPGDVVEVPSRAEAEAAALAGATPPEEPGSPSPGEPVEAERPLAPSAGSPEESVAAAESEAPPPPPASREGPVTEAVPADSRREPSMLATEVLPAPSPRVPPTESVAEAPQAGIEARPEPRAGSTDETTEEPEPPASGIFATFFGFGSSRDESDQEEPASEMRPERGDEPAAAADVTGPEAATPPEPAEPFGAAPGGALERLARRLEEAERGNRLLVARVELQGREIEREREQARRLRAELEQRAGSAIAEREPASGHAEREALDRAAADAEVLRSQVEIFNGELTELREERRRLVAELEERDREIAAERAKRSAIAAEQDTVGERGRVSELDRELDQARRERAQAEVRLAERERELSGERDQARLAAEEARRRLVERERELSAERDQARVRAEESERRLGERERQLSAERDAARALVEERERRLAERERELSAERDQARSLAEEQDRRLAARESELAELRREGERQRAAPPAAVPVAAPAAVAAAPPPVLRPPEPPSALPGPSVSVIGLVARPGAYPLSDAASVLRAVSLAGSRDGANLAAVEIKRYEGRRRTRTVLSVEDVRAGLRSDEPLRDGDVVIVPGVNW